MTARDVIKLSIASSLGFPYKINGSYNILYYIEGTYVDI